MSTPAARDTTTLFLVRLGIAIPFLYFGWQLLAAPHYPDYSFVRNVASELGSDRSRAAFWFNWGMMLQGVLALLTSIGFFRALPHFTPSRILVWLTSLAIAMNGVQTLWAGYYPMPDPRHGGHPVFIIFMLSLPFLLTLVLWKPGSRLLRIYLAGTLVLLFLMMPLMSGLAGPNVNQLYRGLFQRLFVLTVFPPIGVSAYLLQRAICYRTSFPTSQSAPG